MNACAPVWCWSLLYWHDWKRVSRLRIFPWSLPLSCAVVGGSGAQATGYCAGQDLFESIFELRCCSLLLILHLHPDTTRPTAYG